MGVSPLVPLLLFAGAFVSFQCLSFSSVSHRQCKLRCVVLGGETFEPWSWAGALHPIRYFSLNFGGNYDIIVSHWNHLSSDNYLDHRTCKMLLLNPPCKKHLRCSDCNHCTHYDFFFYKAMMFWRCAKCSRNECIYSPHSDCFFFHEKKMLQNNLAP